MSGLEEQKQPEKSVFDIIRSYHHNMTEKEFHVCKMIVITMWDLHWDVAID